MFSQVATLACNIGGARCASFGTQMASRVLAALLCSPPLGIASGIITDLCPPRHRGKKLGWWVLCSTIGSPVGPLVMGFVVQRWEVQWVFWIFVFMNAALFFAYGLFSAETLPPLSAEGEEGSSRLSLRRMLPKWRTFRGKAWSTNRTLLQLAQEPRVLAAAVATAITFCYANIALVVEMPITSGQKLGLNAEQTGLQFIPIVVGCVVGEQLSGPASDCWMQLLRKRKGHYNPADRLWVAYIGFVTVIAGLLVWGFQIQRATTWDITPCIGVGVASFGNQIQSTILTAYAVDICPHKSANVGILINFARLVYGFVSVSNS